MQQFTPDTAPALLAELTHELVQLKTEQLSMPNLEFLLKLKQVPERDRQELLITHLQDLVAQVLGLSSSHRLDPHQGFFDLGMDSLTSIELRNRLQTSLGRSLPSTLVLEYPTLNALIGYLVNEMFASESHTDELQAVLEKNHHQQTITSAELQKFSEEDVEALLLQELKNMNF